MKSSENQFEFPLVKGVYRPDEAKEILFNLISDKIRFHSIQILSAEERFGEDMTHSRDRIGELRSDRSALAPIFEQARKEGKTISIRCDVRFELGEEVPDRPALQTA